MKMPERKYKRSLNIASDQNIFLVHLDRPCLVIVADRPTIMDPRRIGCLRTPTDLFDCRLPSGTAPLRHRLAQIAPILSVAALLCRPRHFAEH